MESWKTAKAVSLRETAIEKMREKDFAGGRKSAAEAQKLCPTLEDIDRVILVCNVHCAAADDKDWYKILDVAAAADESAVRSRCSRMALGLHPDKNKFPGAAEAFQLFVEAKNVLLNNEKRRVYDSMCRARAMGENWSSGFSGQNDQTSNGLQSGAGPNSNFGFARFRDGFKPQQEIDQAIGNLDSVFSRIVNDQQCQQLFHQLNGENGRGLVQSSSRGRGRGKPRGRGSKTNEGVKIKENVVGLDQNDQPSSKDLPSVVSRGRGRPRGRGLKMNEVEGLMMSSSSKENVVDLDQIDQPSSKDLPSVSRGRGRPRGRGSKMNEVEDLMMSSSSKENVVDLDQNDQPSSKDLPSVSRGRGRPRGRGSKMNEVEGLMMSSSSKENVVDLDQNDHPTCKDLPSVSRGRGRPRGRGSKMNEVEDLMMSSSSKENVVDLDQNDQPTSKDLPSVSRGRGRPRGRGSKMNEVEGLMMSSSSKENVADLDQDDQPNLSRGRGRGRPRGRGRGRESKLNEASKIEELMSTSIISISKENVLNLDEKGKVLGDDGEEIAHKAKKSKNSAAAEEADINGKRGVEFEHATMIEPDSKILEYTDAEFNDFEKERCITSFGEGQVWAVYDTLDAMPRFYAMINSITDDHKMQITWLEPLPNNDDEKQWLYQGLPACSGRFKHGHTDTIQDHAVFSHLANWKRDAVLKKVYEIHPKKGETWAVFKNWDISKPQRCGAFEYEVVEILSDYYSEFGVSVALLGKIEGFCCVFGRKVGKGVDWEVIKGKDRLRFSHRIPSVSVTINNPNGVGNFFELDPASLPPNLDGR